MKARAVQIREELGDPASILLGVDRLDYTKGIQQRLQAFTELFEDGRVKSGDAVFVQVATPSRERVEEYRILRDEIELQVGRANGMYAELGARRSSTTCTRPTRAGNWPRCTWRPT